MNVIWLAVWKGFFAALMCSSIPTTTMGQGKTKGIFVKIEDQWVSSNFGYKPIKVTISLNPPRPASETMNFTIVAKQMGNGFESAVVTKPIVLNAGQMSTESEMYVPLSSNQIYGYSTKIHIAADDNLTFNSGRDLAYQYSYVNYYGEVVGMPTILVISSAVQSNLSSQFIKTKRKSLEVAGEKLMIDETMFPSIQKLYVHYPDIQNQIGSTTNTPTAADMLQSATIHAIAPKDVPRSWLGLSSIEIVLISESDLIKVAADAQQIQAIRNWLAVGGSLIVSVDGDNAAGSANNSKQGTDPERSDEKDKPVDRQQPKDPVRSFNQTAHLVRVTVDGDDSNAAERKSPWMTPGKKILSLQEFVVHDQTEYGVNYFPSNASFGNSSKNSARSQKAKADWITVEVGADLKAKIEESKCEFAMFKYVLGRVTVVNDDMRDWNLAQWRSLFNANMLDRRSIRERFGEGTAAIPSTTFAISDVGQPPVNGFKILIGLFVLLVGPASYFILKKQRRLQLLFAVVPAISLVACLGLMMFAILSDGFQNRGRIRSFTTIDHSRQRAVSFARHSHYQGIQPSGYNFGTEEAVFNGKSWTSPRSIYRQSERGTSVNGGDVRPRMPHQFVSVNTFITRQSLSLVPGDETSPPKIRNRFDSPVRFAILTTNTGVFFVENLAPGQTVTTTPVLPENSHLNKSPAAQKIRELMDQISPNVRDDFLQLSTYYGSPYNYYGRQTIEQDSKFETDYQLNRVRSRLLTDFIKQPGQYLAILEEYSDVTVPQDNIDYKNKIHIIHGKW